MNFIGKLHACEAVSNLRPAKRPERLRVDGPYARKDRHAENRSHLGHGTMPIAKHQAAVAFIPGGQLWVSPFRRDAQA